jgi:hypothetical protein
MSDYHELNAFCQEVADWYSSNPDTKTPKLASIYAPVKSGKRFMVKRLKAVMNGYEHVFISAFNRCADESQRKELQEVGIRVVNLGKRDVVPTLIGELRGIPRGRGILLHVDECDYGSGTKQRLNAALAACLQLGGTGLVTYSATPEEVLIALGSVQVSEDVDIVESDADSITSDDMSDVSSNSELLEEIRSSPNYRAFTFTPPDTYNGAKKFLDENLVHEAMPFFVSGELSEQAQGLLEELVDGCGNRGYRNIAILRITGSERRGEGTNFRNFFHFVSNGSTCPEILRKVTIRFDRADGDFKTEDDSNVTCERIGWSDPAYWNEIKDSEIASLIVHEQTASRSTELAKPGTTLKRRLGAHEQILWTHDFRKTITYGTNAQAQLRVVHYGKFHPIRVFGNMATWELAAKKITPTEFIAKTPKQSTLAQRVTSKVTTEFPIERFFIAFDRVADAENAENVALARGNERLRALKIMARRKETRLAQRNAEDFYTLNPKCLAKDDNTVCRMLRCFKDGVEGYGFFYRKPESRKETSVGFTTRGSCWSSVIL